MVLLYEMQCRVMLISIQTFQTPAIQILFFEQILALVVKLNGIQPQLLPLLWRSSILKVQVLRRDDAPCSVMCFYSIFNQSIIYFNQTTWVHRNIKILFPSCSLACLHDDS